MPFLREQWKDSAVKSKHKEEQEAQFKVTLFAENLFFWLLLFHIYVVEIVFLSVLILFRMVEG